MNRERELRLSQVGGIHHHQLPVSLNLLAANPGI